MAVRKDSSKPYRLNRTICGCVALWETKGLWIKNYKVYIEIIPGSDHRTFPSSYTPGMAIEVRFPWWRYLGNRGDGPPVDLFYRQKRVMVRWISHLPSMPFLVTITCFGCSSTGRDLTKAATSSAVFHLASWPRRFWPAQTLVWMILRKSCPDRGLKMKIAPSNEHEHNTLKRGAEGLTDGLGG